jgi:hypothetical protein
MAVIRNSTVIRCTPEEAFDYISDMRNELEWNPDAQSMEKITDGPVRLGTRYRAKWRSGGPSVVVEVIQHNRPRIFAGHNSGLIEVTLTARLEPVTEGTRLTAEFEATPHGWFRLVYPAFLLRIRKQEANNMTYIRNALERRAQAEWSRRPGPA